MAMQPGMITSIEPGVYRPGQWGVRVENLVLNVPRRRVGGEFGEFLEFETLTLCPIDARCIDRIAAAHRRGRLAQRLSRDGRRAPGAAPRRCRARLAAPAHGADLTRPAVSSGAGGAAFIAPWRGSSPDSRPSSQCASGAAKACLESAPTNPAALQEHAMISRLTASAALFAILATAGLGFAAEAQQRPAAKQTAPAASTPVDHPADGRDHRQAHLARLSFGRHAAGRRPRRQSVHFQRRTVDSQPAPARQADSLPRRLTRKSRPKVLKVPRAVPK